MNIDKEIKQADLTGHSRGDVWAKLAYSKPNRKTAKEESNEQIDRRTNNASKD